MATMRTVTMRITRVGAVLEAWGPREDGATMEVPVVPGGTVTPATMAVPGGTETPATMAVPGGTEAQAVEEAETPEVVEAETPGGTEAQAVVEEREGVERKPSDTETLRQAQGRRGETGKK
jgi:hypothetical protein